ncbi:hypothetical protein H2508_04605 [Parahaliea sp. F7430]|uniref:Phage terminase small subunit n=1 Tax=Sediminihaliea albiluteola TaxID=2758564 RepID=A0A7W2YIT5_9GAMM|nr:P27 family phage terminase small subunit [Sediminihaliea albiluteola]MBA6412387.1 hypothetical protein [Sediminihaliea albiluteola]
MAGRTKQPDNIKRLRGTDRPDRSTPKPAVVLPLIKDAPAAPDWLPNAHAIKEWHRLAPMLQATGLLTEGGLAPLAHLCALHGTIVKAYQDRETPKGNMVAQLRGLLNDFGLTPVAISRVSAPGAKPEKENPFNRNGRRK